MKISSSDAKRLGELAELRFHAKCRELDLVISRPCSDLSRYDYLLDLAHSNRQARRASGMVLAAGNARLVRRLQQLRILRVQVKSTAYLQYGAYRINLIWGAGSRPYGTDDFDLLAAYIHPRDIWYLIPAAAFAPVRQLLLSPDGLKRYQRWEAWRENWDLFE